MRGHHKGTQRIHRFHQEASGSMSARTQDPGPSVGKRRQAGGTADGWPHRQESGHKRTSLHFLFFPVDDGEALKTRGKAKTGKVRQGAEAKEPGWAQGKAE